MKELGYKIFAILYRIFCIFPIQDKLVFLIMTHDAGPDGNVRVVADHMKQLGKGYQFACLRREDTYFGRSRLTMLITSWRTGRNTERNSDKTLTFKVFFPSHDGRKIALMQ